MIEVGVRVLHCTTLLRTFCLLACIREKLMESFQPEEGICSLVLQGDRSRGTGGVIRYRKMQNSYHVHQTDQLSLPLTVPHSPGIRTVSTNS